MGSLSTGNSRAPSGIKVKFDPNPFQVQPAAKPIRPGKLGSTLDRVATDCVGAHGGRESG